MVDAGKAFMLPRGDYSATTTYEFLDVVYYDGASYVAKQSTVGNVPTNLAYWQLLVDPPANADGIGYNNADSGLAATDVQSAIDETVAYIEGLGLSVENGIPMVEYEMED